MKYIPNCLTAIRAIGALCMIPLAPFSTAFYVLFVICGITDALDGPIARSTGSASDFGAKFDSVSDLLFYVIMMIKMIPTLKKILPRWVWWFIAVIIVVRFFSYLTAAIKYKRFASVHTYMNKVTGGAIFLVPFFLPLRIALGCSIAVAVIAFLASSEELIIHLRSREYDPRVKSIFMLN